MVSQGADINYKDKHGRTAVMIVRPAPTVVWVCCVPFLSDLCKNLFATHLSRETRLSASMVATFSVALAAAATMLRERP